MLDLNLLRMLQERFGEITQLDTPDTDIYQFHTEETGGYVIPGDYQGNRLSPKALRVGERLFDGQYLFYPMDSSGCVIEYELDLVDRLVPFQHPDIVRKHDDGLRQMEFWGRYGMPEYFGEFQPPRAAPQAMVRGYLRVGNGLFFLLTGRGLFLAVAGPAAADLVLPGLDRVRQNALGPDDFLYFRRGEMGPAIYRLKTEFPDLADCLTSEEDLIRHLWARHPQFVSWYNGLSPHLPDIPQPGAPGDTEYLDIKWRSFNTHTLQL